jgi:hypothetical protein
MYVQQNAEILADLHAKDCVFAIQTLFIYNFLIPWNQRRKKGRVP